MRKRVIILALVTILVVIAGGYLYYMAWVGDFAFHAGKNLYYREHNHLGALAKYKQVKPSSKYYATAQRYIGHNIYGREWGAWDKGVPYLEEALRVSPEDPHVLEDIGRAYVKVGRVEEGVELLIRAKTDVAQTALAQLEPSDRAAR
jgi:hypothetical protein